MSGTRRVLGYARVSSEEQARGSSLQDQQNAIRAHAQSRGLSVTTFFVEAQSAVHEKVERRVEIQRLLREAQRGDLVVCDKLDRWSRDAEFSYRSVRELLAKGVALYFVAERIDPSTSEGDSAMSFRILFAREEHKRIKERMVGTRKILRDQGFYVEGPPPYGYRRAKPKGFKGVEKNVLVVEPTEVVVVRRVFALCIAGRSIAQIAEFVGLKRDRVVDILARRAYLGQIRNSTGEWIDGKHPAILDAATFLRARAGLAERKLGGARPSSRPAETSTWILRDVAACGLCGARMSSAYAGPHEARRYYYRCAHRCTSRFVPVRLVELAFTPLVLERLAELRGELAREPARTDAAPAVPHAAARRAKLELRRARYLEMYADGVMDREAMRAAVAKADEDLLRLAGDAPAPRRLEEPSVRASALRDVATLERAWRGCDAAGRRTIVGQLAVRVALVADGEPVPTWRALEDLASPTE